MPAKKHPQGIKPSQSQLEATDNMSTADQIEGLGIKGKDM